jgi:hypothetical protein
MLSSSSFILLIKLLSRRFAGVNKNFAFYKIFINLALFSGWGAQTLIYFGETLGMLAIALLSARLGNIVSAAAAALGPMLGRVPEV